MQPEQAGAEGPDPRRLIEDLRLEAILAPPRSSAEKLCEQAADALDAAQARIAALEAENGRLYEGWPEWRRKYRSSDFEFPGEGSAILSLSFGDWQVVRNGAQGAPGFPTKREAVRAHLGLDVPAEGGADAT